MSIRSILAGLALALFVVPSLVAEKIPASCKINGFAVGCQAYTFNRFTVFDAIDKTAEAGGKIIEVYPGQRLSEDRPGVKLSHNMSAEDIAALKQKLKERNIRVVNYGVINASSEQEWRKIFEFAKTLGLYGITTESVDQLDTIEKLVKEYNICISIHNHARRADNPNYKVWDPNYVLSVVKDRDKRIGACADTGHWMTSGLDPLECVQILKGRIMSTHLKDYNQLGPQGHCVPYGQGVGKIPEILRALKASHFNGDVAIEYEYHFENSLPEVKECVDYMRNFKAK